MPEGVSASEVGTLSYPARIRESYASDLLTTVDAEVIQRRRFRIVVDYGRSAASYVLPIVLGPLGVEAVAAHAFPSEGGGDAPGGQFVEKRPTLPCQRGRGVGKAAGKAHGALPTLGRLDKGQCLIEDEDIPQ